jgi:uncharacterized protein (DUF1778 family)
MARSDQSLEDPNSWDFENAEAKPPVKRRRAVISVALPPEDLALVANMARVHGMKLSEFIRDAAVQRASAQHNLPKRFIQIDAETHKASMVVKEKAPSSQTSATAEVKEMELTLA